MFKFKYNCKLNWYSIALSQEDRSIANIVNQRLLAFDTVRTDMTLKVSNLKVIASDMATVYKD